MNLSADKVDVWLTRPAEVVDAGLLRAYERMLSPDERERWMRFYFARDRQEFLVSHALLRTTLSRYAPVDPQDWVLEVNAYGRPEIQPGQTPRPIRFNLSHTRGLTALGVTSERDIGVDVEWAVRTKVSVELAERYFARAEVEALRAVDPSRRQARFYEYWTLKESYIKARGMGLALPLDGFAFDLRDPSSIRIGFSDAIDDDPEAWSFQLARPTDEHLLAVALRNAGATADAKLRWTVPLA